VSNRLLLLGQAPGRNGDSRRPLEGRIGRRLAALGGLSFEEYLERTERTNLFDEWPGKNGKGDAWDAKEARRLADLSKPSLNGRRVIFVGRNVASAFGCSDLPWLSWRKLSGAKVAVIPHPSGIVLWWNDERNREDASVFLREALRYRGDRTT